MIARFRSFRGFRGFVPPAPPISQCPYACARTKLTVSRVGLKQTPKTPKPLCFAAAPGMAAGAPPSEFREEPDRHPFLCEPIVHDPVVPKPGGMIVPLPRREVRS